MTGLVGTGLVLADNAGDMLPVHADGTFTFATSLGEGATYAVTVVTQPSAPTQLCTVSGGSGTTLGSNITNVSVNCSIAAFTIGGTVTGLQGSGMVLEDNNGDDLAVTANGSFAFATHVAGGATYDVTIKTQPSGPTQSCTVSGATGTVGGANVTTVVVDCSTDAFTIGGTISGLGSSVVLQDNNGDNTTVTANGTFAFPTPLASGASYEVSVLTQPTSPTQVCTVTADHGIVGSANVTSVVVTCVTTPFAVTVTVTGLAGSGLDLQDNGSDDLAVGSNGTYSFATDVLSGSGYDVTVFTQPINPTQSCDVSGGSGDVGNQTVSGILINCATDAFAVQVAISGLAGTIDVQDNGSDDLVESANGTYAFATAVQSGSPYDVTIASHTGPSQTCVIGNGSGDITDSSVTATIACSTNAFTIGGTLTGLASGEQLVLEDNSSDDLALGSNGSFTFATSGLCGANYDVTGETAPGSPSAETCTVSAGSGTVGSAAVTSVDVDCAPTPFGIDVAVTGLTGTLVMQDNGSDNLTISSDGTYAFATAVQSGQTYDVTVLDQPAGEQCDVTAGTGVVGAGNVTVAVTCYGACFSFTNDANENLTGNDWFDSCATSTGSTVIVDLRDGSNNVVYHATGTKSGTWSDDLLTSTDANEASSNGVPPGYYTDQFDILDNDRAIALDNGDLLQISGQSAANVFCHGSMGDGYVIVIYAGDPVSPDRADNVRMIVTTYEQQQLYAGQARSLGGWSMDTEISYDGGTVMDSCGQTGEPGMTGFDGTFSFTVTP